MKKTSSEDSPESIVALCQNLRYCPHCGAQQDKLALVTNLDVPHWHYIRCGVCGLRGPTDLNHVVAFVSWNDLPRKKIHKDKRKCYCMTCGKFLCRVTHVTITTLTAKCDACGSVNTYEFPRM